MIMPDDILSSIPTNVVNSGLGEAPDYFDPLGVISDIASMVFDFLVWVATGGILLLWVHLVEMGLNALGYLAENIGEFVQDAVDAIVDAFRALIGWALKLMEELATELFSPLVDPIWDCIYTYFFGIANACLTLESDLNDDGAISYSSIQLMIDAILGDLFWIMLGVTAILGIVLSVFAIATGGVSYLVNLALNVLISVLVITLFGIMNVLSDDSESSPTNVFYDFIMDKIVGFGGDFSLGGVLQTGVSCLCCIVDILISLNLATSRIPDVILNDAAIGFNLGIVGLAFCAIGSISDSTLFQMTSLVLSGFGIVSLFKYRSVLKTSSMIDAGSARQLTTIGLIISGGGVLMSLTSLSQEEWFY